MGHTPRANDHAVMDELKLQSGHDPAFRSFRICLDRPQQPTTILGIVRRVAAEQARTGPANRPVPLPHRHGAFS